MDMCVCMNIYVYTHYIHTCRWWFTCTGTERPTDFQDFEAVRFVTQSAYESGKVVSPKQWPPLLQVRFPVLISERDWFDPRAIMQPEVTDPIGDVTREHAVFNTAFRLTAIPRSCSQYLHIYIYIHKHTCKYITIHTNTHTREVIFPLYLIT
jgi:hypothetical protein